MNIFQEIKTFLDRIWNLLALLNPVFAILLPLYLLVSGIIGSMSTLTATVNALAATIAAYPGTLYFQQVNAAFPLVECLGMVAGLLALKITCLGIRWVKSLIPILYGS